LALQRVGVAVAAAARRRRRRRGDVAVEIGAAWPSVDRDVMEGEGSSMM